MTNQKVLVVLSGGMDSATLLYDCLNSTQRKVAAAVNFYYGSKHNDKERECARKLCEINNVELIEIDLSFINTHFKSDLLKSGNEIPEGHYADENMKKTVVPFRNGIMLSIAAGLAESIGANEVALGNHKGDHTIYPDCTLDFSYHMNFAIKRGTWAKIEMYTPYMEIDKTKIAQIGKLLSVPYEHTYTCYKGGDTHCGKCGSCTERKEAFKLAEMEDKTIYEDSKKRNELLNYVNNTQLLFVVNHILSDPQTKFTILDKDTIKIHLNSEVVLTNLECGNEEA